MDDIERSKLKYRIAVSDLKLLEKYRLEILPLVHKFDRLIEKSFDEIGRKEHDDTIKELKKVQKVWVEVINKIEKKHRLLLNEKDENFDIPHNPDELLLFQPVEIVAKDQPYEWAPQERFPRTLSLKQDISSGIVNNFLYLQLDLICDKKKLIEHCDDAIIKAQKMIGKQGNERTALLQKQFAIFFEGHYLKGLSKTKSLENTVIDFRDIGIKMEFDTLEKNYLTNFKKERSITDIRQLRRGNK